MLGLVMCLQIPFLRVFRTLLTYDLLALLLTVQSSHPCNPSLVRGLQITVSHSTWLAKKYHHFFDIGFQTDPIKNPRQEIHCRLEVGWSRGGKDNIIIIEEICKTLSCLSKAPRSRLLPRNQSDLVMYHRTHHHVQNCGG